MQVFEILNETNVTGTQKERLEACFKQYEDPFLFGPSHTVSANSGL